MRKIYEEILKVTFSDHVVQRRMNLNMSQEQFSEKLEMSCRSYSEIDRKNSCCSEITLVLFLIYFCDDVQGFLNELKYKFETADENAA